MAQSRTSRREPDLPISIRNKLRGSRSSREAVGNLRATIKVDLFPALLKVIPLFPYRGRSLLPTIGASAQRFRTDLPVLKAIPLERELAWAAAVFLQNASALIRFVDLKSQFESNLLLGRYDNCEELLNRVENEFGFSIWLLEVRIAFLQTSRGLETQKAYCSHVRSIRREGDLLSFLAHFTSWRNEDTTNPSQFKKTLTDRAADWAVPSEFRTYLLHKLTGECALDDATISTLLRHASSYSLIDHYETYIRLAIRHLSAEPFIPRAVYSFSLMSLTDIIPDPRLVKLASIAVDGGLQYLRRCQAHRLSTDDALMVGDYEAFRDCIQAEVADRPDDIRLWFNLAIAELDSGLSMILSNGLGARFAGILKAVMEKRSEYNESVLEGARLILNYSNLPSTAQFESFFWPQLSSSPNSNPATQLAAFASSRFVEPSILRFAPVDKRGELASIFEEKYGNHRVVDFEKWRSEQNSELRDKLRVNVAPLLFNEVLIEHLARAGRYDEALGLARKVEAEAGPRYRRIAQRWIAEFLFSLVKIEAAIDYVARVCISDRYAIPMMPLARCASALDKKRRAALAGNLSTPIVLDIYDRNFESTYESERMRLTT